MRSSPPTCAPSRSRRRASCSTSTRRPTSSRRSRSTPCSLCFKKSSTRCAATMASSLISPSSSATWTAAACSPAFRTAYQSIAGKSWERGREQALLENANVAKAYARPRAPIRPRAGHPDAVSAGFPVLDRGLRRQGEGLYRRAEAELPAELLCRRSRPVHCRQRQAHDESADDRGEPEHQMPRPGLDHRHGPAGYGVRHRRHEPAPGK